MILIASLGYEDGAMWKMLVDIQGSVPRNCCFITNASELRENSKGAIKLRNTFKAISFPDPICIDLEKDGADDLRKFDLVVILGGNSEMLFRAVHSSGAAAVIEECLRDGKMVAGISAGAMLLSAGNEHCLKIDPLLQIDQGFTPSSDHRGVAILKHYILPHMGKFLELRPQLKQDIERIEQENGYKIMQMFDGEYFIIVNGKIVFDHTNSPKIASA